ncbi:MAG: flagellar biosynthesis anti-sigma factor FlgM [Bacillota bacterium]|nr:flagellar biosynthesis anti-sigma factor FlgM [Bacillota bacterium]
MRINGDAPKVSGIYSKNKNINKVDKSEATAGKKDVLSISNQAKDFQTALKALKDIPEIRTEKVKQIEEKYNSGEYNVGGNEVADKLIDSVINKTNS